MRVSRQRMRTSLAVAASLVLPLLLFLILSLIPSYRSRVHAGPFLQATGLDLRVGFASRSMYTDYGLGAGSFKIAWSRDLKGVSVDMLFPAVGFVCAIVFAAVCHTKMAAALLQLKKGRRATCCPTCHYFLAGLKNAIRCPECGNVFPWRSRAAQQ